MKKFLIFLLVILPYGFSFSYERVPKKVHSHTVQGCMGGGQSLSESAKSPLLLSGTVDKLESHLIHDYLRDEKSDARRILMYAEKGRAKADGNTVLGIGFEILDARGKRLTRDITLTLEVTHGVWNRPESDIVGGARWLIHDEDASKSGVQVTIKNGQGCVGLLSPMEAKEKTLIRAMLSDEVVFTHGSIMAQGNIHFIGDDRPLVMVGLIEGGAYLSHVNSDQILPIEARDPFEEELRLFGQSTRGSTKFSLSRRAAMFLKGKIKGELLLTAAFDSDKPTHGTLFKDIDPNVYYPVYGDSSIKGWDAQSSSRLYVKIEKGSSYAMFGDITTQSTLEGISLGRYSRSLVGGKFHLENKWGELEGFVNKSSQKQFIDEIKTNGTSGPFTLTSSVGRINSEKIEVVTRKRGQPGVVLSSIPLTRYTDYEFEPFSGRILLKKPLPTYDANLNPMYLRVTYEVDESRKSDWVVGVNGEVRPWNWLSLGGSWSKNYVKLGNLTTGRIKELQSAHLVFKPSETWKFITEFAQSDAFNTALTSITGKAMRANLIHQGKRTKLNMTYGYTEDDFVNPASNIAPGRKELALDSEWRLGKKTALKLEGLESRDINSRAKRRSAALSIEQMIGKRFSTEIGLRKSDEKGFATLGSGGIGATSQLNNQNNVTGGTGPLFSGASSLGADHDLLSAKARVNYAMTDRSHLFAEYEQELREDRKKMLAFGGDYYFTDKSRVYARHEVLNSLSDVYGLRAGQLSRSTLVGIDTALTDTLQVYNEYRLRDAQSSREAMASFGLRNEWHLSDAWRLGVNAERLQSLSDKVDDHSTTLALSLNHIGSDLWKFAGRVEGRRSHIDESVLSTLGISRKLNRNWTFLSRNYLLWKKARNTESRKTEDRFQLGFAYREVDENRFHMLARYELKLENDHQVSDYSDRVTHIFSTHFNYQKRKPITWATQLAGKITRENFSGVKDHFTAYLISQRVIYDLTDRWDISPMASVLFSPDGKDSMRYALGAEVGFLARQNVWLSLGYNFSGFYDRDLSGLDYTRDGLYFRLRIKFDEMGF